MKIPDLGRDGKHIIIGRIIQLEYPIEWKLVTAEDTFVSASAITSHPARPTNQEMRVAEEKVDQRYAELEQLTVPELQQVEHQIRSTAAEEADKELWFNRPAAKADVSFWSKKIAWEVDAGTALLFDKEPRYVSWEGIRHRSASPFAKKYGDARDLILEAIEHKILTDPLAPAAFLEWAQKIQMDIPRELFDAVLARKIEGSDKTSGTENKKGMAKSGGQARAAKYAPIKAFALAQAREKDYPSARQAALKIQESVLKFAKENGVTMSEDRASQTLQEWLAEGGYEPVTKQK